MLSLVSSPRISPNGSRLLFKNSLCFGGKIKGTDFYSKMLEEI
jgi:hypothetical protein